MEHNVPATSGRVLHWAARDDLLVWLLTHGRTRAFRERLVNLARLASGESVLDVRCGTGSLAITPKGRVGAGGKVFGIDASSQMVARATAKAARAGIVLCFKNAIAEALLLPDAQFDVVLSTLMLHHLPRKVRQQCVREIRRLLRTQGRVLVVDFALAQSKSGLLAHFHRHGHVDPRDVVELLEEVVGILVLKYGWWRFRRCRSRSTRPTSSTPLVFLSVPAGRSTLLPCAGSSHSCLLRL